MTKGCQTVLAHLHLSLWALGAKPVVALVLPSAVAPVSASKVSSPHQLVEKRHLLAYRSVPAEKRPSFERQLKGRAVPQCCQHQESPKCCWDEAS